MKGRKNKIKERKKKKEWKNDFINMPEEIQELQWHFHVQTINVKFS